MLSHYFVPAVDEGAQLLADKDWLDALRAFPAWAVEQACAEHVREDTRRPTPAAIRERTQTAVDFYASELRSRNQITEREQPKGERITKERAAEIMAEYGFKRMPKGVDE